MKRCDSCGKTFADTKDVFCPHCGAVATKGEVCTHTSFDVDDRYGTEGKYSFHGERERESAPVNNTQTAKPARTFAGVGFPQKAKPAGSAVKAIVFIAVFMTVFLSIVAAAIGDLPASPDDGNVVSDFPVTKYREVFVNDAFVTASRFGLDETFDIEIALKNAAFNAIPEGDSKGVATADEALSALNYGRIHSLITVLDADLNDADDSAYTLSLDFYNTGENVLSSTDGVLPCEKYLLFSEFTVNDMDCEIYLNFPFNAIKISKNGEVSYYDVTKDENGRYTSKAVKPSCDLPDGFVDGVMF